ncbi:extracellular solute-binding protein [Georgenia sp. TF02-10]|uniref:ABC transporter substrate-binding protein n=1 Tax=Georgenia sp. TF02-10 TaxID=2917725 RepID=UPI001FA7AAC5|nr:extracellular solute-binding protein [Georgenia sp. TF02-10]UNX53239.1 extracellular solute-binding protein [Georgenia sp. TF02-10]
MSTTRPSRRPAWIALTAAVTATGLAACSGGDGSNPGAEETGGGDAQSITVWTPHNTPQRLEIQQQVATDFEAETGIAVEVVGMDPADMNTSIVAGAASGEVPDVAVVGPDQVASWASQGLVDHEAAGAVIENLDESTFSEQALDLVTMPDGPGAVPSDGWGELLYYRTDVFEQLGLDAPETVQDVVEAAQAVADSDLGMAGIVLGTRPADAMARENTEHLSLANGCQMFEGTEVTLDSEACVDAFAKYQALAGASVQGDQDVESTRAAYLAGQTAMAMWSPHLLDEIGNLDANFPVTAPETGENPDFLAQNTGVVGALSGEFNDEPTGFGLTMNYAILNGSASEAAQQYVEYVLSDGYVDTLAMTPEGRTPVRTGTPEEPTRYADEWATLPLGADPNNQRPMDEVYAPEVVEQIVAAANSFSRWGFGTENWATAGAAVTQNTVVTDLGMLLPDGDPQAYAEHVDEAVTSLQAENQ